MVVLSGARKQHATHTDAPGRGGRPGCASCLTARRTRTRRQTSRRMSAAGRPGCCRSCRLCCCCADPWRPGVGREEGEGRRRLRVCVWRGGVDGVGGRPAGCGQAHRGDAGTAAIKDWMRYSLLCLGLRLVKQTQEQARVAAKGADRPLRPRPERWGGCSIRGRMQQRSTTRFNRTRNCGFGRGRRRCCKPFCFRRVERGARTGLRKNAPLAPPKSARTR